MLRLEGDSPSSPSEDKLSPRDQMIQRLAVNGVPHEYLENLPLGLVAYARDNRDQLSSLVSAILPTDAEVAVANNKVLAKTPRSPRTLPLKDPSSESMVLLQWLMFEGDPDHALNSISMRIGQRGVCGAVWGKDDVAFRCRTCEHDSTCAICVPCFQNGNHKDHDYSIIYTSGGCCDCGDGTAWKPEGFCSEHSGAGTLQPLPDDIARLVGPVLDCIFDCWKSKLLIAERPSTVGNQSNDCAVEPRKVADELTLAIVEMLLDFCKCSESLLNYISKRLLAIPCLMDILVRAEMYMDEAVMKKLHELVLKLLGDPTFKFEFAKVLVNNYPVLLNDDIEASAGTIARRFRCLSIFSVQIFTVPTLTMRLVKEINLLAVLIECLVRIFSSCSGKDGLLQLSKWGHMFEITLPVIEDIKFVMSHPEVAQYVAREQEHVCRIWLRVISFVQGMNPQKRETDIHVEEENDNIQLPFYLCYSIANINSLLVAGAFSDTVTEVTSQPSSSNSPKQNADGKLSQKRAEIVPVPHERDASVQIGKNQCQDMLPDTEDEPSHVLLAVECLKFIDQWFRSGCSSRDNDSFSSKQAISGVTERNHHPRLYGRPKSTSFQMWHWRGADNEMDLDEMDAATSCELSFSEDSQMEENPAAESESLQMLCMLDWQTIDYDISSQDISVHIPLHGLLSLILKEALGKFYGECLVPCTSAPSVQDRSLSAKQLFFGKYLRGCQPLGFSSLMMEHPLRIRVFCAQVRAGMWKRNGDNALLSSEYYHSPLWSALILELDLFLLQMCAALAPPDLYVRRILERFGLLNYLSLDKEPSSEYESVLVKEMLTLIIQIVKERRYCGSTPSENLQRELVCKLATGDATRSQLQKWLPRDLAKLNQLQEVLDRVAQYSHPSGMKQGKYSLRLSFWKELDLYHLRWNPRDLQDAEEKYLRVCSVSALATQLPKWTNIRQPLAGIASIATCKMVLEIVRSVIFYAATDKSARSRAPDGVLIAGLHLLALGLDICLAKKQSGHLSEHEEISPILAFATEEINKGSPNGSDRSSLLSLLVTLMRMHRDDNLGSFMEAGNLNLSPLVENLLKKFSQLDSGCKSKLQQLAPDIFSYLIQPSLKNDDDIPGFTSTAEKRKAKAREMQNAILAKMRAQQSKFMESVTEENELEESGKEDQVSHTGTDSFEIEHEVCSLCHDSSSTDPVSYLVLLQKSKLVSFVDRGPPSWDPNGQSDKGKGLVIAQTASLFEIGDTASSKQAIPKRQLIQLVQSAVSEFSQGAHPEEINAFLDYIGAHFPAVRKMSIPHIADRRDRTVSSLESLEQEMTSSIMKVMDFSAPDTVMVNNDEISAAADYPKRIDIDTILLGKYIASIAIEPAEVSSASGDSAMHNESALMRYDGFGPAGCDGIHFSSCGHVVHKRCLDRYLSSLRDRYNRRLIFEGGHIVDPDQGEFLCPVCRRLANSVLPADHGDYWKVREKPGSSNMNSMNHNGSMSAQTKKIAFRLHDALHLMESVTALILKGESIETLPIVNRRMSLDHEPVSHDLAPLFRVLVRLYFPGEKDGFFSKSSRVSPPLLMWDTLKYSLISTEIAARSATKTTAGSSRNSLYSELLSGGGIRMALLVRLVQSIKSNNSLDMLLRFRGIHLFAASVCLGSSSDKKLTIPRSREGKVLQILEYIDAGVAFPDMQFWSRASDPVLSRDPFSSLMWILFCLPPSCISDRDSLLCLVHMFYAVSSIQGVIGYIVKNGQPSISEGIDGSLITDFCKLVDKSAITHQYFLSNHINTTSNFEDTVRSLSLPFLRRCALLWKLLNLSGFLKSDASDGIGDCGFGEDEVCQLESMFQIPALDHILADKQLWNIGTAWFHHLRESSEHISIQRPLYLTPAVPFQLMRLPHIYQDLLQRYIKPQCPSCGNVQPDPALCLLCGRLCSPSWKHCCRENGCEPHAKSCGSGTGVFLLMKNTSILLQRNARRAVWASPYLDAFGEEDPDMHRGKPLYLNDERYAALNYMVASHGLDRNSRVLRQTTTGTFFMV